MTVRRHDLACALRRSAHDPLLGAEVDDTAIVWRTLYAFAPARTAAA